MIKYINKIAVLAFTIFFISCGTNNTTKGVKTLTNESGETFTFHGDGTASVRGPFNENLGIHRTNNNDPRQFDKVQLIKEDDKSAVYVGNIGLNGGFGSGAQEAHPGRNGRPKEHRVESDQGDVAKVRVRTNFLIITLTSPIIDPMVYDGYGSLYCDAKINGKEYYLMTERFLFPTGGDKKIIRGLYFLDRMKDDKPVVEVDHNEVVKLELRRGYRR